MARGTSPVTKRPSPQVVHDSVDRNNPEAGSFATSNDIDLDGNVRVEKAKGQHGLPPGMLAGLQRSVGNQAVLRMLQRENSPAAGNTAAGPGGISAEKSYPPGPNGAATELLSISSSSGGMKARLERVLTLCALQQKTSVEFRAEYVKVSGGQTLESVLAKLNEDDEFRAQTYLAHGHLRPIDKVALAMNHMLGVEEEALFRVIVDAHSEGDTHGQWSKLSRDNGVMKGRSSDLVVALGDVFSRKVNGWQFAKAKALARFGKLRPIDLVKVATDRAGTEWPMLLDGLRAGVAQTGSGDELAKQYQAEYHEDMNVMLFANDSGIVDGELSGSDRAIAHAILGGKSTDPDRLIKIVSAATSGAMSEPDLIMEEIRLAKVTRIEGKTAADREAAKEQLDRLSDAVARKDAKLHLDDLFGGLTAENRSRLRAVMDVAEDEGADGFSASELNDTHITTLRSLGGVGSSALEGLQRASASELKIFDGVYYNVYSPLHRYLDKNLDLVRKLDAAVVINGSLWQRLLVARKSGTYANHLIKNIATSTEQNEVRQELLEFRRTKKWNTSLAGNTLNLLKEGLSGGDWTEFTSQVQVTGKIGLMDEVEEMDHRIQEESSWWQSDPDDLKDEQRGVHISDERAREDGKINPGEEEEIHKGLTQTGAALEGAIKVRDEYTGYASQAIGIAVGLLLTVGTGGTSGPAVVAALLRAAAANAIAKVAVEKTLRGDRFDVVKDGGKVFLAGAVEGAMNVLGAGAGAKVLESISGEAVTAAIQTGTASLGTRLTASAIEGGIQGAVGGTVDSVTTEGTWDAGVSTGLVRVLEAAATSAAMGAAFSMALEPIGHAMGKKDLKLRMAEELTATHPLAIGVKALDPHACSALLDLLGPWEVAIATLEKRTGRAALFEEKEAKELIKALSWHRDKIGIQLEHFGASTNSAASSEAGSDKDFNVKGKGKEPAGESLIAARAWLDKTHPGWARKYRMGLMVEAPRITGMADALEGLAPAVKAKMQKKILQESEMLFVAREARAAKPEDRPKILSALSDATMRTRAESLASLDNAVPAYDAALRAGDASKAKLDALPKDASAEARAELTMEMMLHQKRANALTDDAYITMGGIRGFGTGQGLKGSEQIYQAFMDQVSMASHQVHASGGLLPALRSYEVFKYLQRLCETLEAAKINDPLIGLLKKECDLVYLIHRTRNAADGHELAWNKLGKNTQKASVRLTDVGDMPAMTDGQLMRTYQMATELAAKHGGALRSEAFGSGAGNDAVPIHLPPAESVANPDAIGLRVEPQRPKELSPDTATMLLRLKATKQTLEQELDATKGSQEQQVQVRKALKEVLALSYGDINPSEFAVSSTLQRRIFEGAKGGVERMKKLGRTSMGGAQGEMVSLLKREDFEGFVAGVIGKCERNNYVRIAEMDDIMRGRISLDEGSSVKSVFDFINGQSEFPVVGVELPRVIKETGVTRYPRYHIVVRDPVSGITHEWQIGTKATDSLYETKGIEIPDRLATAAKQHGKHFNNDIHDIEYDVFQRFAAAQPAQAAELGIPEYVKKVALASDRSKAGNADAELVRDIRELHIEGSRILKTLVDKIGPDDVAKLFH
jgi:hypothetical protein